MQTFRKDTRKLEKDIQNQNVGLLLSYPWSEPLLQTDCNLNTVRNDHSVLKWQPIATPLLWSWRIHPSWVCNLSALSRSFRSGLKTVQDGEEVQHCHTRERNAELLDISQGPRVENQFPFHRDLSLVPVVVSSTTTSFLSHPYWVTSTPLLPLLSFICQPIHLTFFTQPGQNIIRHPPLRRRSYSHSSSIFSSTVYTDSSVHVAPL